MIITDYEWHEQVFVPPDRPGGRALWKPFGDLTAEERGRFVQGLTDSRIAGAR